MPNITWCDLPEDVSLWPGLPLSLSGDEVMPLDYHAGRSGWLLYGRGLDKQRLTQYQTVLIHLKYEKNREDIGLFGI